MHVRVHSLAVLFLVGATIAQHDPLFHPNHSTIVTLFEWPFHAIAHECEEFLGPNGYGGVQVSPVNEHLILPDRPWIERYQPISYKIASRSGTEAGLLDMTQRCNAVGVRIYVDVVFNHMAGNASQMIGTAGSIAFFANRSYPAVPYVKEDFHRPCKIVSQEDAHAVRNCDLFDLPDLDQSKEPVRQRVSEYLNRLIDLGVAGFRVGGCKYMWPNDLKIIYSRIKNVNVAHGFPGKSRPFIYQEVLDNGLYPISKTEYTFVGVVSEVTYAWLMGRVFTENWMIKDLEEFGPQHGFVHSSDALVFLDSHDLQRTPAGKGAMSVSFRAPRSAQLAYVFMLAHDFGIPRVMSSYLYETDGQGPPTRNGTDEICTPFEGECVDRWVLEHRWPIIRAMVAFRNTVGVEELVHFRAYGDYHIVFCRGNLGFAAFNNSPDSTFDLWVWVCLAEGSYCDLTEDKCSNVIVVESSGFARIVIAANKTIPAIVLCSGYRNDI